MMYKRLLASGVSAIATLLLANCAQIDGAAAGQSTSAVALVVAADSSVETASEARFEQDREAILAMAGDYRVRFDFIETVAFDEDYDIVPEKISGGFEVVRVIEDTGDFVSLQHTLVVGGDQKFAIKHWRQDWQYEPSRVLVFIGGNAWKWRDVSPEEAKGKWSQTVYQVDDAPRYGALGAWTYENGLAEWTPPREWRPLPRRDMTTRDDYHVVAAVNRHTITDWGWVHEQDNSKVILSGEPEALAREVAINTYRASDSFDASIATDYWVGTSDFWKAVREEWAAIADEDEQFAITIQGETEPLYGPLLELADAVAAGDKTLDEASEEARSVIRSYITHDIGTLESRLRPLGGAATSE